MIKTKIIHLSLLFLVFFSCQTAKKNLDKDPKSDTISHASIANRFHTLLDYKVNPQAIPRGMENNLKDIKTSVVSTWTSGFFAGNLWYIYLLTHNDAFKNKALEWTQIVENEKYNNTDHDIGFKINCSFGNAYKITADEKFKSIIIQSAKTLITRYDDKTKVIKSWDAKKGKWDYPVIIDNMMNLELLFEASLLTNDSIYAKIAINHANTTLKNHFRKDHSVYHLVDYLPDGTVKSKMTHQGYRDESVWARGQAWAVYGYTMVYRYTKNETYLNQATQTANFYLNHKGLPSDGIPFWDFDDPAIPNAPKDVSAATVMASAFFELYSYTKNERYLNYANKVLKSVQKPEYLLNEAITAPFILNRSTGNYNKNSEIDCPIVYADYYLLEALVRQKNSSEPFKN